jgi:hypothetical protein
VKFFAATAAIVPLVVFAQAALAHEPAAECVGIAANAARLACYDASIGRGGAAAPTTPAAPVSAAATGSAAAASSPSVEPAAAAAMPGAGTPSISAAAASSTGTSAFGLDREQRDEIDELSGTVVSVANQSHYGRWVVTLDNGQVWEQRETTPASRRPRPGDVATIKKASLGSYLLSAPNRGSNRVRRVQ